MSRFPVAQAQGPSQASTIWHWHADGGRPGMVVWSPAGRGKGVSAIQTSQRSTHLCLHRPMQARCRWQGSGELVDESRPGRRGNAMQRSHGGLDAGKDGAGDGSSDSLPAVKVKQSERRKELASEVPARYVSSTFPSPRKSMTLAEVASRHSSAPSGSQRS